MSDLLPHIGNQNKQEGKVIGIQRQNTISANSNPLFKLDTSQVSKNANRLCEQKIWEENESSESSPTNIMASVRSKQKKRRS